MEKYTGIFYWMPRIICILAILFVSLFAADSFSAELTIWQQLSAFALHLVPSFILIIFLVIAWKWDFIGGIIFIFLGLGFSPIIFVHNYKMNQSVGMSLGIISLITFPFIFVGILFVLNHFFRKRFPKTGYAHS